MRWPGVARRLLTFFASPKKVSKERRPLLSASLRCATGSLRYSAKTGSSSNSPSAQTIARPDPFWLALLGAYRRGQSVPGSDADSGNSSFPRWGRLGRGRPAKAAAMPHKQLHPAKRNQAPRTRSRPPPVLAGPVMIEKSGIRAARCLSEASWRGPPLFSSSAGCFWGQTPFSLRCTAPHPTGEPKARRIWALTPKTRTQTAGRLSFAYFSLAKQRTSESPPGDSRPAKQKGNNYTIK